MIKMYGSVICFYFSNFPAENRIALYNIVFFLCVVCCAAILGLFQSLSHSLFMAFVLLVHSMVAANKVEVKEKQ